uniref:RNA-directed RNA polymerase n=1 Tax=Phasmatodean tombus-related virus TaxID=2822558 RepID=A0A8A6RIN4_9TOMB|nr:RNA-dependent RNA polymerase [Phasmatodean tombus-related virus]
MWQLPYNYSGCKRAIYLNACASLDQRPLTRHDATVSMFVKPDRYSADDIKVKAPRAIQFRGPRFNLRLGKYLHPLEKLVFDFEDEQGFPFMAKGKSVQRRAEILAAMRDTFQDPVFVCLDHSKFDSTVNEDHLRMTHRIYKQNFCSAELAWLCNQQINNRGYSKAGLRYRIRGTRMSGDYDTGLGNSLLNYMCLRSWLDQGAVRGLIFLDGDDSVVIMESTSLSRLDMHHFEKFGFETKMTVTSEYSQVDFCQCRPVADTLCRNPERVLSNMMVTLKNYPNERMSAYLSAVGMAEVSCSSGMPIIQAAALTLVSGAPKWEDEVWQKYVSGGCRNATPVTDEARLDFYEAFGVEPDLQISIESYLLANPGMVAPPHHQHDTESLHRTRQAWDSLGGSRSPDGLWAGEGGV